MDGCEYERHCVGGPEALLAASVQLVQARRPAKYEAVCRARRDEAVVATLLPHINDQFASFHFRSFILLGRLANNNFLYY